MDKDDTAAEERILSREMERLEEAGEPGTSSGEEVDMAERLESWERERLLAALRRSSRR